MIAKKQTKLQKVKNKLFKSIYETKTEIIDKTIETIEYLIAPLTAVCAIWGVDGTAYIAAGAGVLVSILAFVRLFIKD